jgi:hypothetical protein
MQLKMRLSDKKEHVDYWQKRGESVDIFFCKNGAV